MNGSSNFTEIVNSYKRVENNKVYGFFGDYRFLSNFHSCGIAFNGLFFSSTEAAFQSAKTLDKEEQKKFQSMSPQEAKAAGRKVQLREDWDKIKDEVMLAVTLEKFKDPELAEKLLATGDMELEETNHWGDTYWGAHFETGEGQNKLGKILMVVRGVLQTRKPT